MLQRVNEDLFFCEFHSPGIHGRRSRFRVDTFVEGGPKKTSE